MAKNIEQTNEPRWTRALKFVGRILKLLVIVVVSIGVPLYLWNPQRIHYPGKKHASLYPKIAPNEAKLFADGTRISVVVGHPDDAEYFISGVLLKLHETGAKITLIVVTDGDKSYYPSFLTNAEENRRVRRQEQIDASSNYEAKVVFLGGPDGRYNPDEPVLRTKLKVALDDSKPDYILAFDPEYLPFVQHRDHENSGRAALELAAGTTAKWVLLYATTAKNYFVDTSKYWDDRSRLIAIHKSQFNGTKLEMIRGTLFERELSDGEEGGFELAEGFRAIKLKD